MANDQNQPRPISIEKGVKYTQEYDQYTIQMVHRRFPWWVFLLLLPFLLFIRCNKDVEVTCYEKGPDIELPGQEVKLDYTSHFLFKNGKFFYNEPISRTEITDSTGTAVFKDLPCSVYSYIFYCLSKMTLSATSECHATGDVVCNFHYRRHVDLYMEPRREDLHIRLLDLETNDPLPDGYIIYKYHELGEEMTDSAHADPAGVVTLPQMRYCSVTDLLLAKCYGYADTFRVDQSNKKLILPDDSTAMRLRPLKEKFTFFVKNADTRQPIPGAICNVSLTHPSGKVSGPNVVTTSTDGKGIAMYEESFVLSVINITAHKDHFRDSILTGGPWTVENFIKQPDSIRTIWLKPLPYTQEFVNVDSITGQPIPGVRNLIRVTDHDGTVHESEETSNRNGVFPVEAKEDSKVEIISIKDPDYYQKTTEIPLFKDVPDKKIPMRPVMVTLKFRTVNADKPSQLLPNCALRVTGTISGALQPGNSGNGEFDVTFRRSENISIKASKTNWVPTTTKVDNKNYDYLKVDQERRDIPLKQNLPPCNANVDNSKNGQAVHSTTYGMGQESGRASIDVDFYGVADHLKLIDGAGNVLFDGDIQNARHIDFTFHGASVTVIVSSPDDGSDWKYKLNCPN